MTLQILRAGRAAGYAAAGVLLLGLGAANAALAQARGEPEAAARQACAADVKTLCPGIQPGGGKLKQCLRENVAKLSPGCRGALREAKAAKAAAAEKPAAQ